MQFDRAAGEACGQSCRCCCCCGLVVVLPVCRMFHLSQSAIKMNVSFLQLSVAL